jgi:superfamily II DNA or RNA helicase
VSTLRLRPYQHEAIEAVTAAWARGVNRPGVVFATGLGKTVIFAHLCLQHTGTRILVLVHRDELAQQAKAKIHSVAPHLRVGIVMGTRNESHADVVVASVQTIGPGARRRQEGKATQRDEMRGIRADDIRGVGMIIVDEAHHAAAPTWRATLQHFGAYDGVPTAGFTATMSREDNRGLGEIWQEVVAKRDTLWGIRNGFLADVRGIRVQVPGLDLNAVHVRAGDLQQEETAQLMTDANTAEAIAKGVSEFVPERRGPVFAPNVATAVDFHEALNDTGHPADVVLGTTPTYDRQQMYSRLQSGKTRWLVNAMVLTEGWDAPWADCAVIARPTKSSALYQQMVGRVLRPFPGKTDAVVLDVVGATTKHQLASLIDLSPDRPVRDRQSVLEAWDEELPDDDYQVEDSWSEPQRIHKVIGTDVDLFEGQRYRWLQTQAGTWFLASGDLLFFLWPELEDGLVTIGVTSRTRFEMSMMVADHLTFELAMAQAEQLAGDNHRPPTSKQLAGPPSQALRREAAKNGVSTGAFSEMNDHDLTYGRLADLMHIQQATRRLDG